MELFIVKGILNCEYDFFSVWPTEAGDDIYGLFLTEKRK